MNNPLSSLSSISRYSDAMSQDRFLSEYEEKINELKDHFRAYKSLERETNLAGSGKFLHHTNYEFRKNAYVTALEDLQRFVHVHRELFDATKVSSLLGCPSKELNPEERIFHRIWVGGRIPEDTKESIRQWEDCLAYLNREAAINYRSYLWVWNREQVITDPSFEAIQDNTSDILGYYNLGNARLIVRSIQAMSRQNAIVDLEMMEELVKKRFYNYLSDYYRDVLLYLFGGIYMDIDTIPHRYASIYLAKPEVPDFHEYRKANSMGGEIEANISWVNIWKFEGGVQIAKRNNPAVKAIVEEMNRRLKAISRPLKGMAHDLSDKDLQTSLMLYRATYEVWAADLGVSFMPLDKICRNNSVFLIRKTERVILGLDGFRLEYDPTTKSSMPLNPEEKWHRERTLSALKELNWNLPDPLGLADHSRILYADETPRLGYNLQLRAKNPKFNFYAFATDDKDLHRVNDMFGRYLLYSNRERIAKSHFWIEIKAAVPPESVVCLVEGKDLSEAQKDRLAFLLLETSYLEYCSVGNKANLHKIPLQRKQNIDQNIDFCKAMLDGSGKLLGFYIGGRFDELLKVEFKSYYRDEVKPLDDAYDRFVATRVRADDYFLSSTAVEPKCRGQGHFRFMFESMLAEARRTGCKRIVLTVWENSAAVDLYVRMGFRQVDIFQYPFDLFFENLLLMELTLSEA